MSAEGESEESEGLGPPQQLGKTLDPYAKRLPKSAMGGAAGAGVIAAMHRIIPPDFPPIEHQFIDWSIGAGFVACIAIIVRGVYKGQ